MRRPVPVHWLAVVAAVTVILCAHNRVAGQVEANPTELSIDMLRRAVTPQADGSHLALLLALRQLRDPDLKPLFHQLAQLGEWQVQVHATLGLAEIDPQRQVDPFIVKRIAQPAQEAVVATALDSDLLPPETISKVLELDELHPMARLFLHAEQRATNQPPDAADLQRLAVSDDLHIAGFASALLAQTGDAAAFTAFQGKLAAQPARERAAVTMWLMDAARRYELTAMAPWINTVISGNDIERELAYRGTFALLMLDPAKGLSAWRKHLGEQPSFSRRVRCGTLLLACGKKAPAEAFDALGPASGEEEQLLVRIVEVGRAIVSNSDTSAALIALLDLGHLKTSLWAMEYLKELPPEQSRRVYEHLIDRLRETRPEWSEGIAQAVQATTRLFEIEPQAVLDRLRSAEDDSPVQQALLLGLFETTSPSAGEAAAAVPRIGSGRADSLALLLVAKHAKALDDEQKRQLGLIASGGGRVSEILQVQAAWLYLKHSGQTDQALAAVFARSDDSMRR
jgi:hypothetical protein